MATCIDIWLLLCTVWHSLVGSLDFSVGGSGVHDGGSMTPLEQMLWGAYGGSLPSVKLGYSHFPILPVFTSCTCFSLTFSAFFSLSLYFLFLNLLFTSLFPFSCLLFSSTAYFSFLSFYFWFNQFQHLHAYFSIFLMFFLSCLFCFL